MVYFCHSIIGSYRFRKYIKHVEFLDEGVKDIVSKFDDFFNHDGKTTYVFTSDHGMNNWGKNLIP